jgi:hypothetical protein
MMFASLADWTHEELVAAVNEATRLSAAATAKRLEAVRARSKPKSVRTPLHEQAQRHRH